MQEPAGPTHAHACCNTRAANCDTHTRAAYLYAAPALSHRDAHTDRNGDAYADGYPDRDAHRDTYAAPNRNINTKPDPQAGYLKR